ncbi:acyltransferase [Elizabethkingia miricola]|uniref:acyltransferase family protein n=1 Tax=Elizabethkingia miricola TaxID=172045 RepID=UPI002018C8E2|nr:acyltransferase family protein [Elizabethkingia miricola]MCL1656831.1 acyltransferase [Elizabethkingia miricola]
MTKSLHFRTDISFLRAISVIAVLLFHYKIDFFRGGFVGVDIFFVISGYLMTKIILSGISKNTFNILEFYKKRVIRIFPALITALIFFGIAVYFLVPTQFINYCKSAFSSSLFFSNMYYYLNSGYFDLGSQFNFLLHTWSLSVEWQFYMIYPLLLLPFRKLYLNSRKWFSLIFIVLIIGSFISMNIHNRNNPGYAFYIFYTRAWEMMIGGLVFLYEDRSRKLPNKYKNILVAASIFVIYLCIYKFQWYSYLTLVPILATAAILWANVNWVLFSNKLTKFLGDISYSLYLWHWPLYVISLYWNMNNASIDKLIFISLSFIFAIASYSLIERRDYNKKVKFILSLSVVTFICSFLATKINTNIIFNKETSGLAYYASNYKYSNTAKEQYLTGINHLSDNKPFDIKITKNWKIDPNKKNIILLGDSHAGMFGKSFKDYYNNSKINIIQITADATYPMYNSNTPYKGPKDMFNYFFKEYFPTNYKHIDKIIINSSYAGYSKEEISKNIDYTENYFSRYNIPILYIGQNQLYSIDFPTTYYFSKYDIQYGINIDSDNNVKEINKFLINKLGNRYINILRLKIHEISKDGIPLMYDTSHFTEQGANQYMPLITSKINN